MDLHDKVVVITGASAGIGHATALELAEAGAKLVVTARRAELLDDLAGKLGDRVAVLAADIAAPDTAQQLYDLAVDRFGAADVLINNAGVLLTPTVDDVDLDALAMLIRVNFEAVVRSSYVFGAAFKARGSGQIINVSSIGAHLRPARWGVYSGLKAGVEMFTRSLRTELQSSGVRVGLISPGSVQTEMLASALPGDAWREKALQPADIAKAIRFMLEQPERAHVVDMLLFGSSDPS
ncbi:MAG TPA: SDR family oxidoreductase [Novosphingobium sp.]